MSSVAGSSFVCSACEKRHVWKPAMAGRRAKCACGNVVTVPTKAPSAAVEAPAVPAWAANLKAAAAGTSTPTPPATPRVGAGSVMGAIPHRRPLQPEPVRAPAVPSELRDVVLPAGLIVAGLIATVVDATHGHHGTVVPLSAAIAPAVLNLMAGLVLAVAAVFGASAMAGISFTGPIWQNVLKLCAVALLPGPVGNMADHAIGGLNGTLAGVFTSIGLYTALFWAVFEMAWSDRCMCVALIWIIRSGVAYGTFKYVGLSKGYQI